MRKTLLVLVIILVCSSAHADEYRPHYSSSKALVVGINKYLLWPHLEYAEKDAREMSTILKDKGFDVSLLLNENATKDKIIRSLRTILQNTDNDSRIFFYFAGHGQTEDKPGGGERGYIVPVDADLYEWQQTMLPMKDINNMVKKARAKHVFLAFDSCYSGLGLTRGIKLIREQDSDYIEKMMRSRSIQVLTAGGRSEQAIEADGHGLFTDHLLAALSGAADINSDGYTTGTEIYATLRPSVTKRSFNRQTPQFGYIDGEGDFIINTKQEKGEEAFVTVNTFIDGIDVWINGNEKGHRLRKGKHRIISVSGRNNILVKKGSSTLFVKSATLIPGQYFRVDINSDKHISTQRQPFSMFNIVNANIKDYSNSIAYDLDGDGKEEIVTQSGKSIVVFNSNGTVLWRKSYEYNLGLSLIDEFRNEPAIAINGKEYDTVHLMLLNRDGNEIWHNKRKITQYYQGKPDGGGNIAKLADINRDGRKEIIAFSGAGYAWKPRGVIVYDQSGREMWRYLTGPSPTSIAVWERERGLPDIIIGTYSPGNGNKERHNNTDDMHSYVISIDAYGNTNWVKQFGTYFTGTNIMLADIDGDRKEELYAYKSTAYEYRTDEGGVYHLSRNGSVLNRFEIRDSIKSLIASGFKNRRNMLYAADKSGKIYSFNERLDVMYKRSMNKASIPLIINLVGVHDYDGDGGEDILLYSFNQYQEGKNPRGDYGPRNKVFYSNMKYQILSSNFSKVIKEVSIAEEWDKWRGFKLIDLNRPEMPQYPFVALSDKITIFNF